MIYITYRSSELAIKNVWEVYCQDIEEKYIKFMHVKAKEINVVIHPYWLSLMNWQDHNNHLSIGEYGNKVKQWGKILRQWNIDKFISEVLNGTKKKYYSVVNF